MNKYDKLSHSLNESNSILACIIGCNIVDIANLFYCADRFDVDLEYAIKQILKSKLSYKRIIKQIVKESVLGYLWEVDYFNVRKLKNILDSAENRVLKITVDHTGKYNIHLRLFDNEKVVHCYNDIVKFFNSYLEKENES